VSTEKRGHNNLSKLGILANLVCFLLFEKTLFQDGFQATGTAEGMAAIGWILLTKRRLECQYGKKAVM
jgi:hypothetical protein